MAEKSILFSTEMVKAIQAGRKTMTRRIVKPQPPTNTALIWGPEWYETSVIGKDCELKPGALVYGISDDDGEWGIKCPYAPSDVLWVRETWYYEWHMHDLTAGEPDLPSGRYSHRYVYKADNPDYPVDVGVGQHGWRPSIHMPRAAARLFLRVKSVRVERVQEISERDADAEIFGGDFAHHPSVCYKFSPVYNSDGACIEPGGCYCAGYSLVELFSMYWNDINKKRGYGWDVNPWVWVIEFEVIKDATD